MTPLQLFLARLREVGEARAKTTPGPWWKRVKIGGYSKRKHLSILGMGKTIRNNPTPFLLFSGNEFASRYDAEPDGDFIVASRNFAPEPVVEAMVGLLEYARHDEGCSAPFGYPCKCRYDEVKKELEDALSTWAREDSGMKEEGK